MKLNVHRSAVSRGVIAVVGTATLLAAVACSSSNSPGSTTSGSSQTSASSTGAGTETTAAVTDVTSETTQSSKVTILSKTFAGMEVATDPQLAAKVPAEFRDAGVLKDITFNNAPPDELVDDKGVLVGWEPELGEAVATVLGLQWKADASGAFDTFIPGLKNGRYNASFTSFIATADRLKEIDILTYYNVGTGFAVKTASGIKIGKDTDVCGHSVAVIAGGAFIQQIEGINCAGAGLAPVDLKTFPSEAAAKLAVDSGRVEIYSTSANQLGYFIKQTGGDFQIQSFVYMPTPEGAGITKGSGLGPVLKEAMDSLIKSGVYKAIMNKWGIHDDGLVSESTLYTDPAQLSATNK